MFSLFVKRETNFCSNSAAIKYFASAVVNFKTTDVCLALGVHLAPPSHNSKANDSFEKVRKCIEMFNSLAISTSLILNYFNCVKLHSLALRCPDVQ